MYIHTKNDDLATFCCSIVQECLITVNCTSAQCVPVDMGSTEKVLEEFDNVMCQNVATAAQNPRSLIDAASLLWRLEVR